MGKNKKKKSKEKVVYYDDNSTIADMSNVTGLKGKKPPQSPYPRRRTTFKEKWRTYWSAVKMMLFPMFMVLLALGIIYLIIRIAL